MGKIEEVIYENYKRAILEQNFDQANKAVELGKILKIKIETDEFLDYDSLKVPTTKIIGKFFNPYPYKYYPIQGTVELASGVITLSSTENKLFSLFSQNETRGKQVKVVTKRQISTHMWGEPEVADNRIRINIFRLRKKIEPDFTNPQILINYPSGGYLFLGNKVEQF